MVDEFQVLTNKLIEPEEFAGLMASVGWGIREHYDFDQIGSSIEAYSFAAHIRNSGGKLVAYIRKGILYSARLF